MDPKKTLTRISPAPFPLRPGAVAMLLLAGLASVALLVAPVQAHGAVGVEKVSRSAGAPGATVDLTVACGFCYPPCHGAPGHRNTPCMLGTKAEPPKSFAISLVPIEKVPRPHPCGPNALCSPQVAAPPGKAPFTYLGRATPPDDHVPAGGKDIPRYLLSFPIPDLRPGVYAFVIYCEVCARGKGGSLIADPASRLWHLRVRASNQQATSELQP